MCEPEQACDLFQMLPAGWEAAQEDVPHMDGDSGVDLLRGLVGLEQTIQAFRGDCEGPVDGHCPIFKLVGVDPYEVAARYDNLLNQLTGE